MRIPISTYRLQFGRGFGFREARDLVPYLSQLGISDVYASPIFAAHSDIASGYDIVDPTSLNASLGSRDDFNAFCSELQQRQMGLVLDIVPNHMAAHTSNRWWKDVLENGASSPYAYYFDVEWDPPSRSGAFKINWPILGAPYGEVLERQELSLGYSEEGFAVRYFDRALPIDPATYGSIFSQLAPCEPVDDPIPSVTSLIRSLPPSTATGTEEISRRYREKEELKRWIWSLYTSNDCFHGRLDETIRRFNGVPGDPRSFDLLDDLLGRQPYVLSFWKVAREKVSYRRFFDITGLIGVNVEEEQVFDATHSLAFELVGNGQVTGLRIDHIDGLYDPAEYLRRLRNRLPDTFIVIEKILEPNEDLSPEWPVAGTTGYDFIDAVDSVMVEPAGLERLTGIYREIAGDTQMPDVIYEQKKRVIEQLFGGEIGSLALHLNLLAEMDRYAKDASPQALRLALIEVTACLPVYRTYTRSFQVRPPDLFQIDRAFLEARRRNGNHVSEIIWSFVRRVLLLECPPSLTAEQRAQWKQFVQRWQQFCGPAIAKGKEDTAFYLYNRLISQNEVGGRGQPCPLAFFHKFAEARSKSWPHTLNAGSTHDTKRGEDARARIQLLAETADRWARHFKRWQRWNARCKRVVNGQAVPAPNEEYFIYQSMIGAWPLDPTEMDTFRDRLQNALIKAWREAKLHTSWAAPDKEFEAAVADFVATILTPGSENRFLPDFAEFQQRIAAYGVFNSLSQTLIHLTAPGVPDIYQGSELWDLSLVDPDNRRPVDFGRRQTMLAQFAQPNTTALLRDWPSGAVKQFVIQRVLAWRRDHAPVFGDGEYVAFEAQGRRAKHVIAFARHAGMAWAIAVAPRFPAALSGTSAPPVGKRVWKDTEITLSATGPRRWSNVFTGETLEVPASGRVSIALILRSFPVALLTAQPDRDPGLLPGLVDRLLRRD